MSILTSPEPVLADSPRSAADRWFGNRRAVVVSAVAMAGAGVWFGWPALVAAGVAPVIWPWRPVFSCVEQCAGKLQAEQRKSASAASTSLEAHEAPVASGASSPLGSGYACCAPTENQARRSSRQPLPQPGE